MPKKPLESVADDIREPPPIAGTSVEEKLDMILAYMHRSERRDRLRTTGGFIRGLLGLIPLIILVWSTWYFFTHGDELLKKMTSEAVKQSAEYSQDSLMEQFEQYMGR